MSVSPQETLRFPVSVFCQVLPSFSGLLNEAISLSVVITQWILPPRREVQLLVL